MLTIYEVNSSAKIQLRNLEPMRQRLGKGAWWNQLFFKKNYEIFRYK